jgi:hypothetical protein
MANSMQLRHFFVLVLSAALCACQGISPRSLARVETEIVLTIPQDVRWKKDASFGGGRTEWIMAAGDYKAKFTDVQGTYYVGSNPCLYSTVLTDAGPKSGVAFGCGFFVPKDSTGGPKVFVIEGSAREQLRFQADGSPVRDGGPQGEAVASFSTVVPGGLLGLAIADAEVGNFVHAIYQPPPGWLIKR